jgi:deoxyribodipyrimidine photo-lyase
VTTLLWLQRALRLDDNPALQRACHADTLVIASPQRLMPCTPVVSARADQPAGARQHFRHQCLIDLSASLQSLGQCLLITEDDDMDCLLSLLKRWQCTHLILDQMAEPGHQQQCVRTLQRQLPGLVIDIVDCNSLLTAAQLGWQASSFPKVFSQFRRQLERRWPPIDLAAAPTALPPPPGGMTSTPVTPAVSAPLRFTGGEQPGRAHLQRYLFVNGHVRHYKHTRNGMLHDSDGSRLSVWLADGVLSPRRIWREIDRHCDHHGRDEHSDWLQVELLWREFFRWSLVFAGEQFYLGGAPLAPLNDTARRRLLAWQQGRTGIPLVDANMQELHHTGFMSNRGRQNVASFLIHDLGVHWLHGASWFERQLIDFDHASNLGNWAYIAGCGHDPRPHRQFNMLRQAQEYDGDAEYVSHWLPELARLPVHWRHACFAHPDNPLPVPVIPIPPSWQPFIPARSLLP